MPGAVIDAIPIGWIPHLLNLLSRAWWQAAITTSLKSGLLVLIAAWMLLYAWAVPATIYDDHNRLVLERDRYAEEVRVQRAAAAHPDPAVLRIAIKDRLGSLQRKADSVSPNDEEKAKAWARETRDFIRAAFGDGEAALFLSDAGFVFYGGGEDTRVRNWMIGRLKRLGNLIERADTVAIRPDFKP